MAFVNGLHDRPFQLAAYTPHSRGRTKTTLAVCVICMAVFECQNQENGTIFSLTVITLTVCVIHIVVFEYQNQAIFNVTVFDGGPLVVMLILPLVSKQKCRFWSTKSKSFFIVTLFEGGCRYQTKRCLLGIQTFVFCFFEYQKIELVIFPICLFLREGSHFHP